MSEDETFQLTCPRCDHTETRTVSWLKSETVHLCTNCGANLEGKRATLLSQLKSSTKPEATR